MKSNFDTTIQFSGLKSGRYEYHYALDGSFFKSYENEELSEGKVNFDVILERRERTLVFNFSFNGFIMSTCDRCLGEIEVPVSGQETLCVKFSDNETSDNEDVLILPESAYQIDLAQWMYEYVVVSMPIQKVHPEGQCDAEMLQYLSNEDFEHDGQKDGSEGESRDTDPRWDALKQLIDK